MSMDVSNACEVDGAKNGLSLDCNPSSNVCNRFYFGRRTQAAVGGLVLGNELYYCDTYALSHLYSSTEFHNALASPRLCNRTFS